MNGWTVFDDQSCVVAISFEEKGENSAFSLRPDVDVINSWSTTLRANCTYLLELLVLSLFLKAVYVGVLFSFANMHHFAEDTQLFGKKTHMYSGFVF